MLYLERSQIEFLSGRETQRVLRTLRVWSAARAKYRQVWSLLPFGLFLANTIFITGVVTVGSVLSCSLAGYAFARLEWPGRKRIFLLYLGTMMIPGAVTMIPVFSIIRAFHWIDT